MGHQCRLKPYQNFHESQKFGPRKFLKLAQCLPSPPGFFGYLAASPDRARDGWGTCEEPLVHLEGVLPPVVQQLSLNDHDQHDQHDGVVGRQRVFSTASPLLPAPALAALLSQHHSHFLASPVGYLYERGDRKKKTCNIQKKEKKKKK